MSFDRIFRKSFASEPAKPTSNGYPTGNTMDVRCIILAVLLTCVAQPFCDAQGPSRHSPMNSPGRKSVGVLVLVDGKVLTGHCLPRPDGYDVEVAGGRLFVDSKRVRLIATDLEDAYQRMRAAHVELTPEVHMELAHWCLQNKLPENARQEVLETLHLDPNRADARRLLESIVAEESRTAGPGLPNSRLTEYPSLQQKQTAPVESRSLAGLSRSIAQDFTRHIQPLLMNKCANGGCHGGKTTSGFQLVSAHRGTSPAIAEKNLAAVLNQIDLAHPASSPLLSGLDGTHGNLTAPLFRGRSGAHQMNVLRAWVKAAANDIAPNATLESESVDAPIVLTSAHTSDSANAIDNALNASSPPEKESMLPHGRKLTSADTEIRFLNEAKRANARDAFDPALFNRRFHANAGRKTTEDSATAEPVASQPSSGSNP